MGDEPIECRHGIWESTCSLCLHPPVLQPKKQPRKQRKHMARKDPTMELVDAIAKGETCGICLTSYAPMGCHCSRREGYAANGGMVELFAATTTAIGPREVLGIAMGTEKRIQRRAALTDEQQFQRRLFIAAQVESAPNPTWHAPRTSEASHLPV